MPKPTAKSAKNLEPERELEEDQDVASPKSVKKTPDGSVPVKVTKMESAQKSAKKAGSSEAPATSGMFAGPIYKQWWVYAAGGALVLIIVGIGWMTFGRGTNTGNGSAENTNVAVSEKDMPFAPDLMGGNQNERGHFYPLAMMIDNSAPARPQSGLQGASIVYEALVEGGITRFMAVFDHGDFSQMGPVRSARPYFIAWLAEYDAAYAHAGGSPEALANIRADRVHDINGIGNAAVAFFRDKTRPAPHNLYTKMFNMTLAMQKNKLDTKAITYTPWTFGTTTTALGTPATSVDMFFAGKSKSTEVAFAYDATKEAWLRSSAGKVHTDRLTNQQISVTNVIVQRIPSKISVGEKGRLTMTVTGTGTAKLFQNGQVYDLLWSKTDASSRTTFTYTDGTPAIFLPGNIWIEVLPDDRTLTVK